MGGPFLWQNLIRNWIIQGISYMDIGELTLRIFTEIIVTILIYFTLLQVVGHSIPDYVTLLACFLIAHTINWIFNGNFWALLIFAIPPLKNRGNQKTINYLNKVTSRLKKYRSIGGVLIYGSLSRGQWHNKSDIDLRILRKPGFFNLLQAYLLISKERMIAAFAMQPLDMFLADSIKFLRKMRSDEIPIILLQRDDRLNSEYPCNPESTLDRLDEKT